MELHLQGLDFYRIGLPVRKPAACIPQDRKMIAFVHWGKDHLIHQQYHSEHLGTELSGAPFPAGMHLKHDTLLGCAGSMVWHLWPQWCSWSPCGHCEIDLLPLRQGSVNMEGSMWFFQGSLSSLSQFFGGGSTGIWTKGLELVRQVFYCLNYTPSLFFFGRFFLFVSVFMPGPGRTAILLCMLSV
jgi:hypothetical protein